MFEITIIVIIALIYVIPMKGFIKVGKTEGEFMDNYKSFDKYVVYEEAEVTDLIGGEALGAEIEDIPTMVSLDELNNDFEDIDLGNMGGN